MATLQEEIGARMRAGRIAAGMTQAQLAAATDLSRPSVANMEAGRQDFAAAALVALARALDVTVAQLIGEQPMPVGILRPHMADLVATAIKTAGLKQVEVARSTGISTKHINQIVSGKVWPAPEIVDRILAACGQRIVLDTRPIPER